MNEAEALRRAAGEPTARLATVGAGSRPHLVPIGFALVERVLVSAVDHKPKSTRNLKRLQNIEVNPEVTVLVDRYSEDWSRLWWVRLDGRATITAPDPQLIAPLVEKYPQYRDHPPDGPVIRLDIDRIASWEAASG